MDFNARIVWSASMVFLENINIDLTRMRSIFSIHGVGYQSVEAVTLFRARTADAFIIVNACVCPFWVFVYQFLKIPLLYGKAVQLFVMIR